LVDWWVDEWAEWRGSKKAERWADGRAARWAVLSDGMLAD